MLIALATAKPQMRRKLLASADPEVINMLAQLAANILYGNVPLNKRQLNRLKRYRNLLRLLRHKQTSVAVKRKQLLRSQHGGFLPLILPIISSVVGGLIGKAISSSGSKK